MARRGDGRAAQYNPDQPHVPAGSGRESGEWTFSDASPIGGTIRYRDGRIVVAREDEPPKRDLPEPRHDRAEHNATAPTTPSNHHQGQLLDHLTQLPVGIRPSVDLTIDIPLSRFGEAAAHMRDAQLAGKPTILTIDRPGAYQNRADATGRIPKVDGIHLDDYPSAMSK